MKKIIIAIDGYSGCGKSTTAKAVAKALGYVYIDTGAMYRAVTLYFLRHNIACSDAHAVVQALQHITISFKFYPELNASQTYLNGENVEHEIRQMRVSEMVSEVSRLPQVRHAMVAQQQAMGKDKGIVMDGRDIGTHVFPNAELKIFMTADMQVRAGRRQAELAAKGEVVSVEEIVRNLQHRDHIDTTRAENPLRRAEDAYLLDSTPITIEEQTEFVVELAKAIVNEDVNVVQATVLTESSIDEI